MQFGYGVDIKTHKAELTALGCETSNKSLIPVEIVDAIEKKEIEEKKNKVTSKVSSLNLTQYQIYALISRAYNYGLAGGLEQATDYFIYPSKETFVSAYNKYYKDVKNEDYYGNYTKTDFTNKLFTSYMTWLNYAETGTHPAGWEYRRKSEWCLFQTGYFGYDLKYGSGHGMDEYCTEGMGGGATGFTNGLNLYNGDGSVNKTSIQQLDNWLTNDLLNTVHHNKTYQQQNGPFAKWWNSSENYFTSRGLQFQCTWYAYGRANQYLEAYGTKYKKWPGSKGNAGTWYAGSNKYFACGSVPRQNSLVIWGNSSYGHVAYVEAVDTVNNRVYISHAGGGRSWYGVSNYSVNEMKTLYGYTLLGYIYLDSPR